MGVKRKVFDFVEESSLGSDGETHGDGFSGKRDRISGMPDEILLHILSFLPTEDAIKTGMLSQRWLHLWTSVPTLEFTKDFDFDSEFVSFVDQTLILHKCCDVKKFTVVFDYDDSRYASNVDDWVRFAMRANVEELRLDLEGEYEFHYELPLELCTNSSIRKLNLSYCDFEPNGLINWKSLKSLSIGYVEWSEDEIQDILVGSPVLEYLELYKFCGFNRLDIDSASLRKLVLRDYWLIDDEEDYDAMLEISAPYLQSLDILDEMCQMELRLMNVQSLDDCNLNFWLTTFYEDIKENDYEVHRNMLRELLDRLRHVKELRLGNWFIQVLSILELKGVLPPLSECKCLILDTLIKKCDVPGIAGLLQSSPKLETLVINMTSSDGDLEYGSDRKFPENYWTSQKWSSKCSPLHLKTIKIVFLTAQHDGFGLVITLLQFLLEKARALERILINEQRNNHIRSSLKESPELAQKLLSLPRSSPHVAVMFTE